MQIFRLSHQQARTLAVQCVAEAPDGYIVRVSEPTRTLDQNATQWPILEAFAKQLEWPINGRMTKLSEEDWKDILTAAFRQENVRVAPGLNGGMVLLGARTRDFRKREFSDWLDFLNATAADRGVKLERVAG